MLRIDVIADRHEHRPTIGIVVAAGHCGRPMHCRRQVQVRAGLELPAPLHQGGDRAPGSGGEERRRETEARSDLTPDEAAEAERAEHHGHVKGRPAAAHPFWQGDQSRHVEAREARDPGNTGNHASQERRGDIVRQPEQRGRRSRTQGAGHRQPVGPEPGVQPRQGKGSGDGRRPDATEQNSVERRSARELRPRDERQQCPVGAREQKETSGSDQGVTQRRAEARVA